MATQIQDQQAIEAIDPQDDASSDSGFSEPDQVSTASLQSSIFNYEEENGRTYHAFRRGKYVMPNDESEQERMDIHYHSLRLCFEEKHWIAPLESPTGVLDIGTGTGIWAMDVADDHPSASVIAIDLSPIQPTAVPPNLEFQIMDADETWDFGQRFDLVHARLMGFSTKSWKHFFEQAWASLNPGGWVETQDFDFDFKTDDGTMPEDSAVLKWQDLWCEGIEKFGLTAHLFPEKMKEQMEEIGFINVKIRPYKLPIGPWPKDPRLRQSGLFCAIGLAEGLSGISARIFTHGLGWTVDEMEVLLAHVRNEWKNKRIHSYCPLYIIYGQKPPSAES